MYSEEQKELMLREYQKKAVDEVMYCIDKKIHALLYKPTGGGKTECAVAITFGAIALKKRVLFVCNRKDLVRQTKERYAKYGINAGIIQHGEKHIEDADVYILSIDSLKTRKEIVEGLNFEVIIIDEAHNHFNRRAYELYEMYQHTDAVFVGLTATPFLEKRWNVKDKMPKYWLGDETKPIFTEYSTKGGIIKNYHYKSFGYLYDRVIKTVTPLDLKEAGYLSHCDVKVYNMFSGDEYVDEDGEFDDDELTRIFTDPSFLEHMGEQYLFYSPREDGTRKQGLAFCISIEHSFPSFVRSPPKQWVKSRTYRLSYSQEKTQ